MNEKKNRNDRKTLPFPWEYGQEEITLKVSSYAYGNGLAILMYCQEEGELELFDDLTVNLPGGYGLEPQEAFISGDFTKDKLAYGHKHIDTTIKYLNLVDDQLMEASDQYYAKHSALYDVEKLL